MSGLGLGLRVNALRQGGAAFTPDSLLTGITNSFWRGSDGALFQDAAETTPATATDDPIGGVGNQSSIGTATLTQSTTSDKFKLGADGRIVRDGTTNTQRLLFDISSINLATGFCLAVDFESSGNGVLLGSSNASAFLIFRSTTNLAIRYGTSTITTVSGVLASRARVIITGNDTDFVVVVDGVEYGPYSAGATASHNSFVIGTTTPSTTSTQTAIVGAYLLAEKDLRANVAEIDAWMEANA